jgi:hypothetical protein
MVAVSPAFLRRLKVLRHGGVMSLGPPSAFDITQGREPAGPVASPTVSGRRSSMPDDAVRELDVYKMLARLGIELGAGVISAIRTHERCRAAHLRQGSGRRRLCALAAGPQMRHDASGRRGERSRSGAVRHADRDFKKALSARSTLARTSSRLRLLRDQSWPGLTGMPHGLTRPSHPESAAVPHHRDRRVKPGDDGGTSPHATFALSGRFGRRVRPAARRRCIASIARMRAVLAHRPDHEMHD